MNVSHLVGTGTSVRSPIIAAELRRMKADRVFVRKSTSPTRMFEASAPGGILRIKLKLMRWWSRAWKSLELTLRSICDVLLGLMSGCCCGTVSDGL